MKAVKIILFVLTTFLIPIGYYMHIENNWYAFGTYLMGFVGLILYYVLRIFKQLIKKQGEKKHIVISVLIIITTFILFLKYHHVPQADIPALIIIPIFILYSIINLIFFFSRDIVQSYTSVLLLIICVPLFTKPFYRSPRPYIPIDWYSRYVATNNITPDDFNFYDPTIRSLIEEAKFERATYRNKSAIEKLNRALFFKPTNSYIYFELGQIYAHDNKLKEGISYLDSAQIFSLHENINIYNQRALMYKALRDYDNALDDFDNALNVDSTLGYIHANKAIVYIHLRNRKEAEKHIQKAFDNNFNIEDLKEHEYIMKYFQPISK